MKFSLADPISKLSEEVLDAILNGSDEKFEVQYTYSGGGKQTFDSTFKGIIPMLNTAYHEKSQDSMNQWAEEYMNPVECNSCHGNRLNKEALSYRMVDKSIAELARMSIGELAEWLVGVEDRLSGRQQIIASEILKEIRGRLDFLLGVGLDYLSLNNPARTLSGGEAQRIRLATQIGSQLEEVLYILDEPSAWRQNCGFWYLGRNERCRYINGEIYFWQIIYRKTGNQKSRKWTCIKIDRLCW